ncbi:hypothetical protein B0H14DRAFT_2584018 [Mycena olivaceomarginata]|nr:hypothetical protein B0H14DRAFT_2584018 [Mycena olivaceomarginata]
MGGHSGVGLHARGSSSRGRRLKGRAEEDATDSGRSTMRVFNLERSRQADDWKMRRGRKEKDMGNMTWERKQKRKGGGKVTPPLVGNTASPRTQISSIAAKEGTRMHRRPPLKHPHTRPRAGATRPACTHIHTQVGLRAHHARCATTTDGRVAYELDLRRVVDLAPFESWHLEPEAMVRFIASCWNRMLANGVLDVRGYAWRGADGNRNSPEWGCYIVDRWRGRFFFTRLTLIYTAFCTTATNDIPCVRDSVWRHRGWTANFNAEYCHRAAIKDGLGMPGLPLPVLLSRGDGGGGGRGKDTY